MLRIEDYWREDSQQIKKCPLKDHYFNIVCSEVSKLYIITNIHKILSWREPTSIEPSPAGRAGAVFLSLWNVWLSVTFLVPRKNLEIC